MFNKKRQLNRVFSEESRIIPIDANLLSLIDNGKLKEALSGNWILKRNQGWQANLEFDSFGKPSICVEEFNVATSLYVRTISKVELKAGESLIAKTRLQSESSSKYILTLSLFLDENLEKVVFTVQADGHRVGDVLSMLCKLEGVKSGTYYCLVQINLPAEKSTTKDIHVDLTVRDYEQKFEPVRFNMRSFGPYTKASARLRCWKLGETLKKAGHLVSTNSNASSDVVYYQKVKDIKHFKGIDSKENRLFIFDFDDNYFLPEKGSPVELLSFMNQMDIVTVGSRFLYDIAKDYHPNLIVLENPADIIDSSIVKSSNKWCDNVGWFGAPENLLQLKLVDYSGKVTTITRDGDIEFDIYTVDEILTNFGLLLFPLEMTSWNSAKNANRLIKAVSLGIPVLASATAEHIRVVKEFGLDDRFLVHENESWQSKIDQIVHNYEDVCELFLAARKKALDIYSVERITKNLFESLFSIGKRKPATNKITSDNLYNTHFININFSALDQDFEETFNLQEISLDSYKSVQVFSDFLSENKQIEYKSSAQFTLNSNPLSLYESLDTFIDQTGDEFILLVDRHVSLLKPAMKHICFDYDVFALDLTEFEGVRYEFPRNNLEAHNVLLHKQGPKALLVKTSWLKKKQIRAGDMLSYFSLAIWFEALTCNHTSVGCSEMPLGIVYQPTLPANVSDVFYKNILKTNPSFKTEIPNIPNQWIRLSYDIMQTILSRNPSAAVSVGAKLLQFHYTNLAKGQ